MGACEKRDLLSPQADGPQSLAMDAPDRRSVQLPDQGPVVGIPEVGGLHL